MAGTSMSSAARDQYEVGSLNVGREVSTPSAFDINLQFIGVFWVTLFLSSHGNAQITQIGNIGPASSWAAQVVNSSCSPPPSLFSFIKSITVSSSMATMVTYQQLSGEPPCDDEASGNSVTISNTFTCFDATWTVLTGTSKPPWTYTFSTSCPASFAIRNDYMIGPQPVVDNAGGIWVFFNYQEVPVPNGDEGKVVAVRESTDGGASWNNPAVVLQDTSGSCSDGNNCAMNGTGVGIAPNGNIVLLSGEYDYSSGSYVALLTTHYDGSRWSTPRAITAVPPGQTTWSWCYAEQTIFRLPGGALGAEAVGTPGPYPAMCGNNVYLLISCDNGRTWGSGKGCRGRMHEYADSTMRPIGTPADFPTEESTLNWIGGRTLLGFIRNLTWRSGCPSPCGPLVEMYSKDLGFSWTFADTNIEGQAVDAPTESYEEVDPWLYYTGFGRRWTLFYGDRESTGTYAQMVRQITFDPESAIRNPSDLTPGQILYGQPGPDALGSYAHAIPTSRWNLLIWFDMYPVELIGAREVLQIPASYLPAQRRHDRP